MIPRGVDRRPIAARDHPLSQRIAHRLARSGVTANSISIVGLVAGCAAGLAFAATELAPIFGPYLWFGGALLIQLRLAANMFDGMVALETGTAAPVGELYNEVPDRISDCATLIGIGIAVGDFGLGAAAALGAVATAYIRAVGKGAGARSDFSGPMAKQQRMFLLTVLAVWMALAPAHWQPTPWGLALPRWALWIVILGTAVTALRRLVHIGRELRRQ